MFFLSTQKLKYGFFEVQSQNVVNANKLKIRENEIILLTWL